MTTTTTIDTATIPAGTRVEHTEWTDGTFRPQRGTVLVLPDTSRHVAWDGTTGRNLLTPQLAAKLVQL